MDNQQRELVILLVKRAELNLQMQDIEAALKDLQTAIEKDPTYVKVRKERREQFRSLLMSH